VRHPAEPCPSCPWRTDQTALDIPNFDIRLAERLAATCPDAKNMGPSFDASIFACHQSKPGREIACAGWLASVGRAHPVVRLAVGTGKLDVAALGPGEGWPALHRTYPEVLRKLRRTHAGTPHATPRRRSKEP
jgi:hypothetical protein